jgi:uncharacterized membrane protein
VARDWALFLHLLGVFAMVGGSVAVTALRLGAIGRERPSHSALMLRGARPLVPLVGGGLVLTTGAGFWLADQSGFPLSASWLHWTYGLIAYLAVVGAVAGRRDRHTRELAERVARQGDAPSEDLARRLRDPVALTLDVSMLVAMVVIVALMVWKP